MKPWKLLPVGVLRVADGLRVTHDAPEWSEYLDFLRSGQFPDLMEIEAVPPPPPDYVAAGRAAREREIERIRAADPVAGLLAEREIKR